MYIITFRMSLILIWYQSGVIQLFSFIGSLVILILPDGVHHIVEKWGRPGHIGAGLSSWPTDFSRDILPIPCHSHNDYWRTVPLYSAIESGCIGVEADVWLFDEQLYVGHSVPSLTPNRTIDSLYIKPLLDILAKQNPRRTLFPQRQLQLNGVFDTTPEQSLIFLIDFKTAGDTLWPFVQSALEPLRSRSYLTNSNGTDIVYGPITVVGTGNTPFDLVNSDESNPHHDIFFDAPLSKMFEGPNEEISPVIPSTIESLPHETGIIHAPLVGNETGAGRATLKIPRKRSDEGGQGNAGTEGGDADDFDAGNSFYASVAFGEAIGQLQDGQFSEHQMDLLRGQIRGAHKRGLKARYWDLPFWPIGLRNHVWDVLVKEGVDLLNVDDLKGATRRNWNEHHGWWKRMKGNSYNVPDGVADVVGRSAGASF